MPLDLIYEEFIAGFCKLFLSQYLVIISLLLWKGHGSFFFVLVVRCCSGWLGMMSHIMVQGFTVFHTSRMFVH